MIALLLALSGAASAQALLHDTVSCLQDNASPVAGTSGVENALSALRVNAQTYSATRFAEDRLFPAWGELQAGDDDRAFRLAYEHNQNLGVAGVPLWFSDEECPDEYRFSVSPVDLYATNFGAVGRWGQLGFYYTASVTFGTTALATARYRTGTHFLMPMLTYFGLYSAALSGGSQVVQGTSAYALDWLGGATWDNPYAQARVGYARSKGLHVSLRQPQSRLFANGVVRDGLSTLEQYAAGVERLGFGGASEVIGVSSLFARGVPLTDDDSDQGALLLRTGHLDQQDIGGWVDLSAAWATAPEPLLHQAVVAVHNPEFNDPEAALSASGSWRLAVGMLRMPTQWYYAAPGGPVVTARFELASPAGGENARGLFRFSISYNDPEQLTLFPFAQDAAAVKLAYDVEF